MRVLLVDDDKNTLNAMACFLDDPDVEMLPLTDSVEAARHITNQHFDAMIIDVCMPSPDGLELTRLARQTSINCKAAIVLVTGYDDLETRRKGSEAGATCFAGKPVTPANIRRILHVLQGAVSVDQRNAARWPFHTQVHCRWGFPNAQSLLAESLSLGRDGMSLKPSGGLTVGQEMELEFNISPLWPPLLMRAKVDRFEPPDRIAVQFLDVRGRDYEAIQSYITQRLHG
jgi:CheY-like chemotaxis protein